MSRRSNQDTEKKKWLLNTLVQTLQGFADDASFGIQRTETDIEKERQVLIQFRNSILTAVGLIASIIIGLFTVLLDKKIPIIQLSLTDVTLAYILIIDLVIGAVLYFAINLFIFGRTRPMYGMMPALFNQLRIFAFLKNYALSLSFDIEKQDINFILHFEKYMTVLVLLQYQTLNAYNNMSKSFFHRKNQTAKQMITTLEQQIKLGMALLQENKSELIKDDRFVLLDQQVTAAGQLEPILGVRDEAPKKSRGSKQHMIREGNG